MFDVTQATKDVNALIQEQPGWTVRYGPMSQADYYEVEAILVLPKIVDLKSYLMALHVLGHLETDTQLAQATGRRMSCENRFVAEYKAWEFALNVSRYNVTKTAFEVVEKALRTLGKNSPTTDAHVRALNGIINKLYDVALEANAWKGKG